MTTTIFIIRHGEINNPKKVMYGGSMELLLNEKGRKQIRDLAKRIQSKGFSIEKIYTSPMKRTMETAKILADSFGIDNIVAKKDLHDVYIPYHVGRPITVRDEVHATGTDEYDDNFVKKGNEARDHLVNRVKRVFDKVLRENSGKSVAVVSHGDPIQFLLFRLFHPGEIAPPIPKLNTIEPPPEKGEAVRLVIDNKGNILERETIQ